MAKCEFHDEGFCVIHDSITEIKGDLKNGVVAFKELEKGKLSWRTFTWVIALLMGVWMATQGVIWSEIKHVGQNLIKLDKTISIHLGKDVNQ